MQTNVIIFYYFYRSGMDGVIIQKKVHMIGQGEKV